MEYADSSVAALAASETVGGGLWTTYDSDPLASDLLTWRYKHMRPVPGPYIYYDRFDADLGPIQGKKRLVIDTGQTASQTATVNISYQPRSPSALVFWEVTETNSDGTGSTGNPAFPIHNERIYDVQRGNVSRSKQIVIKTGSETATETLVSTTVTKTYYEPYEPNSLLLFMVIDTFIVPGPRRDGNRMDDKCQGNVASIFKQLLAYNASELSPDVGYLDYVDEPIDSVTKERTLIYAEHGFPILFGYERDPFKNNRLITTEVTVVDAGTSLPSHGIGTEQFIKYQDAWRSIYLIKTYENPTPYAELRHGAQVMPALWNSTDPSTYAWSDACGAFSNIRGEKPMLTLSYVYHEWFDASVPPPALQPCIDILPAVLILGRGWQYGSPLLCDSATFTYTGGCTAAFTFPATSPSYTTYTTTIQNAPGAATIPSRVSEELTLDNGYYWHRQTLYQYYK